MHDNARQEGSVAEARERIIAQLRTIPALSDADDARLSRLADLVRPRSAPAGAVIFSRNDRGDALYLLVKGRAKTTLISSDGRELALSYMDAPTQFGSTGTAEGETRAADVVAVTDVDLLMLDSGDLKQAFMTDPGLAIEMIQTLSLRLRQALDTMQDLAFHDASHRVMRILLNVATAAYESVGAPVISGMTHYEIATLAGTSRETASRTISALGREGVLLTRGRKIFVDLYKLRERLGDD